MTQERHITQFYFTIIAKKSGDINKLKFRAATGAFFATPLKIKAHAKPVDPEFAHLSLVFDGGDESMAFELQRGNWHVICFEALKRMSHNLCVKC